MERLHQYGKTGWCWWLPIRRGICKGNAQINVPNYCVIDNIIFYYQNVVPLD